MTQKNNDHETTATLSTRTFKELGLDGKIQKALAENGFEKPFPIQEVCHSTYPVGQRYHRPGAHGNRQDNGVYAAVADENDPQAAITATLASLCKS